MRSAATSSAAPPSQDSVSVPERTGTRTYSVVRLAPGSQWEYAWDQLGHGLVSLPTECVVEPCSTCEQPQDLSAQAVTLHAQAHTSCVEDDCECGSDACEVEVGAQPDGTPLTVDIEFDPAADTEVVVAFG